VQLENNGNCFETAQISGRFRSNRAVSTLKSALRTRRPPSLNLRRMSDKYHPEQVPSTTR
jgi:hypothetical protein